MALLKRIKLNFLPYPLVTCSTCGHYGVPVGLRCEKCGADLHDVYDD